MKHNLYYTLSLLALIPLALTTGCAREEINLPAIDESRYQVPTSSDLEKLPTYSPEPFRGNRPETPLELSQKSELTLTFKTTQQGTTATLGSLTYDAQALSDYNQKHGTDYAAFPSEGVTILASEGTRATEAELSHHVNLTHVEGLLVETIYVVPLTYKEQKGQTQFIPVFVRDLSGYPGTNKPTGVKIFSCMEVNDTNPLNNLPFTLKHSGKQLIDVVILFSANINYNEATGRAYVYNNENVQALLDHREKYLKPLQDRGIKVVLGILGNHDRAGVANLGDEAAKDFAREVSALCDAYSLDGVFLDDEYSNYGAATNTPGFVYPSSAAASRLCYELKQAMPKKMVVAYVYGRMAPLISIDGKQPGEYIDYALHDYKRGADLDSYYPGLSRKGWGLYSQEFNRGYYVSSGELRQILQKGCGAHMIFAMDPNRYNAGRQIMAMRDIARYLFNDELVYDGTRYKKDW